MTPDIREKAERLARNWFRGGHAGLADDISQALLEAHNAGRAEERERCIRAAVTVANEGGDTATCLTIAEELRCPDIATKRLAAIRNPKT